MPYSDRAMADAIEASLLRKKTRDILDAIDQLPECQKIWIRDRLVGNSRKEPREPPLRRAKRRSNNGLTN